MVETTVAEVIDETPATKTWLDELIERLKVVITKLLIKLGIKIMF